MLRVQSCVGAKKVGAVGVRTNEEVCQIAHIYSPLFNGGHEVSVSFLAVATLPSRPCARAHSHEINYDEIEVLGEASHDLIIERAGAAEAMTED